MQNLVLIGMPGSGKSKVGSILAPLLKRQFVDLDEFNFQEFQRDPADFLAELGSEKMLDLEAKQTQKFQLQDAVVATSGSTPLRKAGIQHLRQNALTLWLKVPVAILASRIEGRADGATRIVGLQGKSLAELAHYRHKFYAENCDLSFTLNQEEPATEVAKKILALVQTKLQ